MNDDRAVFPVPDGAQVFRDNGINVSDSRVYQMCREGKIAALRVGRRVYIPRREIERLLGLEAASA
jgi:excisionase family DNA binding protein